MSAGHPVAAGVEPALLDAAFLDADVRVPSRGLDLRLGLGEGDTLAIMGPNGAGKSSFAAAVTGTLPGSRRQAEGRIVLGGRTLLDSARGVDVPAHRRSVALMAQAPMLFPHLDALDNVAFGPRSRGASRTQARNEALGWLDKVGGREFAGERPWQISGGQAQTVALARALATRPRLLLLDEPLNALDVTASTRMRGILKELLAGQSAILITHEILDALTLASHTAILHDGRVVASGPTRELFTRPPNVFAAKLAGLNLIRTGADALAFRAADVVVSAREPGLGAERSGLPSGAQHFPVTAQALEPRGETVLLRAEGAAGEAAGHEVSAEADVSLVAAMDASPGSPLWFSVPESALRRYRPAS